MQFEENLRIKNLSRDIGFGTAFLVFASIFYLILSLLHKIPDYVKYWHVISIIIFIYVIRMSYLRIKK